VIWRLCAALCLWATAAWAETTNFPALYDVSGVASDDVLNIRSAPEASSDIIATLQHDAKGIEVVGTDDAKDWAIVNAGEQAGWVSLAYLRLVPDAMWTNMSSPLACYGTEPFWDVMLTPRAPSTLTLNADAYGPMIPVWESGAWGNPLRMILRHDIPGGEIVSYIEAESCNDGMSDREFGLSLRMIIDGSEGGLRDGAVLRGCCSIAER
tara:strand:- start:269 stop:898 length:630 start_codon:yes stop_codon:yes gene_type:complete